jgi:hypothetical protein
MPTMYADKLYSGAGTFKLKKGRIHFQNINRCLTLLISERIF